MSRNDDFGVQRPCGSALARYHRGESKGYRMVPNVDLSPRTPALTPSPPLEEPQVFGFPYPATVTGPQKPRRLGESSIIQSSLRLAESESVTSQRCTSGFSHHQQNRCPPEQSNHSETTNLSKPFAVAGFIPFPQRIALIRYRGFLLP